MGLEETILVHFTCTGCLLDDMAAAAQLSYLSDLRNPDFTSLIACCLGHMDANLYSLRQWQEAATYLLGEHFLFTSPKEAKRKILDALYEKEKQKLNSFTIE